jgi:hypothetical protein
MDETCEMRRRQLVLSRMKDQKERRKPHFFGRYEGPWGHDARERFPELTAQDHEKIFMKDYVFEKTLHPSGE